MGGKWFSVDFKEEGGGSGGYAKESSDAFKAAQKVPLVLFERPMIAASRLHFTSMRRSAISSSLQLLFLAGRARV